MSSPFTFAGSALSWAQSGGVVTLIEGTSFAISTEAGDMLPGAAQGLFHHDTRLLARWELLVDGQRVEALSAVAEETFAATFVCRAQPRHATGESTLLVLRRRLVGEGMREDLTLRNHGQEATAVTVSLVVEADFADLLAVKAGRATGAGDQTVDVDGGHLAIHPAGYRDAHGVVVRTRECADPVITPRGFVFRVVVPAHGEWHACLEVTPARRGEPVTPRVACGEPLSASTAEGRLASWRKEAARIQADHPGLDRVLQQVHRDLGALRLVDPARPERAAVAAGAPWYLTLFGRDSLLTSWMAMLLDPQLAVGTLHQLAALQGRTVNLRTEEQPGRILHEIRHGHGFGAPLGGDTVYYGSADATPLFVMLVGELYRWGLAEQARELLPAADRALAWIEEYGDADGDGFVEYRRGTDVGLVNQGWKDSWDGVSFVDGRLAEPPIALCEVQAYVYGAYRARAAIAHGEGDGETAARWTKCADELRELFRERFWLPDARYVAFALDRDKRPVDALTSNAGHCLWTGILHDDQARQLADHLLSPAMFSGWGVRTLATSAARYNPVSYHNGSVWPHDTALIASGLARHGLTEHAHRLVDGLLAAADGLDGRLPELFCGFSREEFARPVPYPSSCSPQAWSAAAPLLLVRAMLGWEPDVPAGEVRLARALPTGVGALRVQNLRFAGAVVTVTATDRSIEVEGLPDRVRVRHTG